MKNELSKSEYQNDVTTLLTRLIIIGPNNILQTYMDLPERLELWNK